MQQNLRRRTLLALIGGGTTVVAGCLDRSVESDQEQQYYIRMVFTTNEPADRSKIHFQDDEITEVGPIERVIEKRMETMTVITPTDTAKMGFLQGRYNSVGQKEVTEIELSEEAYQTTSRTIEEAPNNEVEVNGVTRTVIYVDWKGVLFQIWTAKE